MNSYEIRCCVGTDGDANCAAQCPTSRFTSASWHFAQSLVRSCIDRLAAKFLVNRGCGQVERPAFIDFRLGDTGTPMLTFSRSPRLLLEHFSLAKAYAILYKATDFHHPECERTLAWNDHVFTGEIFDVAVDLRLGSPSFGRWHGATLSGENKDMLWIPRDLFMVSGSLKPEFFV